MTAIPPGYVEDLHEPHACAKCGHPAVDTLCTDCLIAAAGSPNGSGDASEVFRLTVRTAVEIVAIPDPPDSDLLLGPLVLRGARTIIVGDTGHGKTTFALQMAAAVLTGEDMLGYTGIGAGPVLIIDLEQGRRSIKRSIIEARLEEHNQALYVTQPDGLSLGEDDAHLTELHRIIDEYRPIVVVLDPFYKAHRGDANEEKAIVILMRILDGLRAKFGFALLMPAHPRKEIAAASSGIRKLTIHDVSGSAAITRGAEVVLGLERVQHGYARLRPLKDRDGDLPVGEAWPLLFERGTGFRLDPKDEKRVEDLETLILNDQNDWRTAKEWARTIGTHESKAREILERLREAGSVLYVLGSEVGRHPNAKLYRTDPGPSDQFGSVPLKLVQTSTDPTALTSIDRRMQRISSSTDPEVRSEVPDKTITYEITGQVEAEMSAAAGRDPTSEELAAELHRRGYTKPTPPEEEFPF